jgi:tRNA A37 threonylcarbamoyladenosine biosynthesis protein TsaE
MGMSAPAPRTLGREAETRALVEALDRVASGASAIVLIEGEAGIGKTRLLQDGLVFPGSVELRCWIPHAGR